jgi:putative protein-disulfide isomerase
VADLLVVSATVFTHPFCPWCWAAEPHLRRLETEFGGGVTITFVIGSLPDVLGDLAQHALDILAETGMPVDARVFLRDPPASGQPAGLAVQAVAEQHGGARVGAFLRRLREAVLLERRRMDTAPALLDAARETGGLDLEALRVAFGSSAIVERLGADLERAAGVPLPSIELRGADGSVHAVRGYAPWEAWREAAVAAGAMPSWAAPPDVEAALRRYGAMATPEVALVCDLPGPRAPAELWRRALDWRVRPRRVPGGEIWAPG